MTFYNEKKHLFKINSELHAILGEVNSFYLASVGLPSKVIYQEYAYFDKPENTDQEIILGETIGDKFPHNLIINKKSLHLFHKWNFDINKPSYVLINTTVQKLSQSLSINEFVIKRLIIQNTLGDYHIYHEKYAMLLEEMILETDKDALNNGAWLNLIEEMKLGVI
jgi:hypothetical protein